MKEETKSPFRMYSQRGTDIISEGYHDTAVEIVEITSGEVSVQIGTDTLEAARGDFIYIPSGFVFRIISSEGESAVRSLVFDTSIIEENMENFDTEILYMFYVQSKNKISVFREGHPVYSALRECIGVAYDEYVSKDVCYKLPIRANIYLIMTALLRYYCGTRDELDRMIYHNVMRLRPVIEYISEHYAEKIYIESLSDMITVSPDYFTKMFKDSIGKTPIDYINALRINHALKLLLLTDTPINEISDAVGFSGPNYFHKIFKQYMITSPLAYRKTRTEH
ncbi:MAG: helix-turn-helix transcriptional regulator [Clostridia bacterium]|nr:helix-turn-helix transcriptional regulator [Clostridia bacterium]